MDGFTISVQFLVIRVALFRNDHSVIIIYWTVGIALIGTVAIGAYGPEFDENEAASGIPVASY